jgi:hypothetical protein
MLRRQDRFRLLVRPHLGRSPRVRSARAAHPNPPLREPRRRHGVPSCGCGLLDVSGVGDGAGRRIGRVLAGEERHLAQTRLAEPRSATITAVTPCVAKWIPGERLPELLDGWPEIGEMLSRVVSEQKLRNAEKARRLGERAHEEAVEIESGA